MRPHHPELEALGRPASHSRRGGLGSSRRGSSRRGSSRRVGITVAAALLAACTPMPTSTGDATGSNADRVFSSTSAWNRKIPSGPVVGSKSKEIVAYLSGATHPAVADLYAYGVPIWDAGASTPRVTVDCSRDWGTCALEAAKVPIPSGAVPSTGSDAAMVVIDRAAGKSYEFYRAAKVSSTRWTTAWGGVVAVTGSGTPGAAVGSGISRLAGVVRTYEIARGRIDHALVFSSDNACAGRYRYPASKTDGVSTRSNCIPEGARIQLDPSINVSALSGLSAAERTIARALQVYGAYAVDNGGGRMAFIFEAPSGESDPYCAAGLCRDYQSIDLPWSRLRVLRTWTGG